jgi:hypothetical protein
MRRELLLIPVAAGLLAVAPLTACSSSKAAAAGGGTPTTTTSAQSTQAAAATGGAACSGGLTGGEPGVVSVTCDGPADIRIQVGSVTEDLHGGRCQSAGDIWSASVGVVVDKSGAHGKYAGPPVTSVAINNTSEAGKATVQAALDGKVYFALGTAALTLSADQKTAHIVGTSDPLSDAPNAKITVDVTC